MNDEAVFGNEMSSFVKRVAELYIPLYDQQRRAVWSVPLLFAD